MAFKIGTLRERTRHHNPKPNPNPKPNDEVQVGCDCVVVTASGSNTMTDPVSLDWAIDKVLSGLTPNTCTCKGTSVLGVDANPAYMFAQAVCLKLVA